MLIAGHILEQLTWILCLRASSDPSKVIPVLSPGLHRQGRKAQTQQCTYTQPSLPALMKELILELSSQ